jgi:hypothetical protein
MIVILTEGDSRKLGWQMLKIDEKSLLYRATNRRNTFAEHQNFHDPPFVNVVCYRKTREPEVSLDENEIAMPS